MKAYPFVLLLFFSACFSFLSRADKIVTQDTTYRGNVTFEVSPIIPLATTTNAPAPWWQMETNITARLQSAGTTNTIGSSTGLITVANAPTVDGMLPSFVGGSVQWLSPTGLVASVTNAITSLNSLTGSVSIAGIAPIAVTTTGQVVHVGVTGVVNEVELLSQLAAKQDVMVSTNSTAPGVNDDVDGGHVPGDIWVDLVANIGYVCLDNTDGAAIWGRITPSLTPIDHGSLTGLGDDDHDGIYYTESEVDDLLDLKASWDYLYNAGYIDTNAWANALTRLLAPNLVGTIPTASLPDSNAAREALGLAIGTDVVSQVQFDALAITGAVATGEAAVGVTNGVLTVYAPAGQVDFEGVVTNGQPSVYVSTSFAVTNDGPYFFFGETDGSPFGVHRDGPKLLMMDRLALDDWNTHNFGGAGSFWRDSRTVQFVSARDKAAIEIEGKTNTSIKIEADFTGTGVGDAWISYELDQDTEIVSHGVDQADGKWKLMEGIFSDSKTTAAEQMFASDPASGNAEFPRGRVQVEEIHVGIVTNEADLATPDTGYSPLFLYQSGSTNYIAAMVNGTLYGLQMSVLGVVYPHADFGSWRLATANAVPYNTSSSTAWNGLNMTSTTHVATTYTLGGGYDFNGSSSYIELDSTLVNAVATGAVSGVFCWVKPDTLTSTARLVSFGIDGFVEGLNLILSDASGNIRAGGRSESGDTYQSATSTGAPLTVGSWQHVGAVIDYANGDIFLYHNGLLISSNTTASFGSVSNNWGSSYYAKIGSGQVTQFFDGRIDDVQWVTSVPTTNEVYSVYQAGRNSLP